LRKEVTAVFRTSLPRGYFWDFW